MAVYVLSTNNDINATKATVANAAAMSSAITANAKSNSDFSDIAKTENRRLVVAISIPATNIVLIVPDLIASNPPNKVKITVVTHPKVFE